MLVRIVFLFAIFFSTSAVDLKYLNQVVLKYPELQSCIPTSKMFDASGKFPDGLMSGNLFALGNFDQCLSIDEINNKSETIKGKYCLMKLIFPLEKRFRLPFHVYENNYVLPEPKIEEKMILQRADNSQRIILGWCLPHTCPVDNLSAVITSVLQVDEPEMKIVPVHGMCQTKDDLVIKYDTSSIILITFLSATLFLMIISTLYDMYIQRHKREPAHIILIAFSVKTNGHKLLSVSNHPDQLPCLNGIKFLSMMWVVCIHRFYLTTMVSATNLAYQDWRNNPASMYILNSPVAVDTFFVTSGLLVAYGFCLSRNKGAKFNIILYYLHRYIRLTPSVAMIVWFNSTLVGFFGSGPLWLFAVKDLKSPCVSNWWATLIYINNYYHPNQVCVAQTWYLAVDMQLFILSPIILIPLWKWPKQTLMASAVLVLGSIASGFALTYIQDIPNSPLYAKEHKMYMRNYYYPTHTRFGPWLIGLMLGYYLFKLKKNKISLNSSQVAFGWIVSLGLLFSSLFAAHGLLLHPEKIGNSFFNGFHRHGWALGVCWVIFACTQGYGGPINSFLSCSAFQILSRFTYAAYLVHLSIETLITGSSRSINYFQHFQTIYSFLGDLVISLAVAVCLVLAYEWPMITIDKILFSTGPKPKKPEFHDLQNKSTCGGSPIKVS